MPRRFGASAVRTAVAADAGRANELAGRTGHAGRGPQVGAAAEQDDAPNMSASARHIYDLARPRLLQVRTLLRDQDSQASVGSGSLVGPGGLILTTTTWSARWRWSRSATGSASRRPMARAAALQLIAFDVVHDLALVRMTTPLPSVSGGAARVPGPRPRRCCRASASSRWAIRWTSASRWSRAPTTAWSSAASCRRSCSRARSTRDERRTGARRQGPRRWRQRATRRDGQQIAFLVPAEFAQALIARGAGAKPITGNVEAELARQLLQHQEALTKRFVALPWREIKHAHYTLPVPQEEFMRCWGSSTPVEAKGLQSSAPIARWTRPSSSARSCAPATCRCARGL